MDSRSTSMSFIEALGKNTSATEREAVWRRFDEVYRPFLLNIARSRVGHQDDAEDIVQDTMRTLQRSMLTFEHNGRNGAFRNYLRQVFNSRLIESHRKYKDDPRPVGGTEALFNLGAIADPLSDDHSVDQYQVEAKHANVARDNACEVTKDDFEDEALRQIVTKVRCKCNETSWRAFELSMYDDYSIAMVADRLDMSVDAAKKAVQRVKRRLKEAAEAMLEGQINDAG